MLKIHSSYSLRNNTTFGVDIVTPYYTQPENIAELRFALEKAKEQMWEILIIGEGSNLLFTNPFDGLIIHPAIGGIEVLDESDSEILVRAGAGVNWDEFVAECVSNRWYGAENLSLIPGSVGAAPVQNIGAYGVEAKDFVEYVEVIYTESGEEGILSNTQCEFGYRDSVFKHGKPGCKVVSHVVFRLKKKADLILDYGNVRSEFEKRAEQTLDSLRETIIAIRESKLPDPEEFGNAGSYFKNPVIAASQFADLKKLYPDIPGYSSGPTGMKVPAAWLIEKSGWKAVREGEVGTWPKQPLVIVNYGNASGSEVLRFSEKISDAVFEKFNISLEREVTILP